ncbi:hypothetical protein PIB30_069897 [Stylosanthes scabra]|uniref:Senescence regulator n=1 Tax=Stylosanthes scabra TaxID=79078 RepID=A0ABU6TP74_9FABA|nr:hypothetical protein [Stylosanthes scabra]
MASRKSFLSKTSYMFESTTTRRSTPHVQQGDDDALLEFDEADLWNNTTMPSSSSGLKRGSSKKTNNKKKVVHQHDHRAAATSLPVNIPDWSKILKQEHKEHRKWDSDDDDDDDDSDDDDGDDYNRVPPHEYLAKTRGASLSVHEGIGRTLKGRDLRSVRNAIWKKVGFED